MKALTLTDALGKPIGQARQDGEQSPWATFVALVIAPAEGKRTVDHDIGMCTATLLGDPLAPTERQMRDVLEATAAAGFTHISIWAAHLALAAGGKGYDAARAVLDDLGLRVSTVEASTSWVTGDPPQWGPSNDELVEAAAATGATRLLAACLDPGPIDEDLARRGLDDLMGIAESAGATVCLEFLPWSAVPDLGTAWKLVESLPGAALLIDTFHWQRQRGGPVPDLLATIPGDRIGAVQVCDAAADVPDGDLMTEAMTARLLPGDGAVDIAAVLAAVEGTGAEPVVTAEIFNTAIAADGPAAAALAMREACNTI